jgi:hypothetical protein
LICFIDLQSRISHECSRSTEYQGRDAAVLGCTEIPPLPPLDSTRLLVQAALREALSPGAAVTPPAAVTRPPSAQSDMEARCQSAFERVGRGTFSLQFEINADLLKHRVGLSQRFSNRKAAQP